MWKQRKLTWGTLKNSCRCYECDGVNIWNYWRKNSGKLAGCCKVTCGKSFCTTSSWETQDSRCSKNISWNSTTIFVGIE